MTIAMATLNVGKKTGSTRERPGADPRPLDEEAAWSAVLRRAPSWDGRFVYGVASTGIYCRPTCPSRRPLRRQVSFFADPRRAEAAGFRACRRCRPHEPAAPWRAAVERARAFLETHPEEPLTLVALAREAGLSPHHLQRAFKRATGLSPKEYASALRTRRFKAHVRDGRSVTAAIYEAGYGSGSRVYESADARLGMTPGAYRKGGHGMQIRYALVDSPLGRLLVGATERGLCAVQLGDSGPGLEAGLRQEYPRAELERDDAALAPWVAPILDQLRGATTDLDLPLDVLATSFEWRVWKALQEIPYGATRSYADVAVAIGNSKAVRAVAGACARNRVALVVPCHRVVRSNGDLGGYRWGAGRKRRLLQREKAAAEAQAAVGSRGGHG